MTTASASVRPKVNTASVPAEMRALGQWVVWRREPDPKKPGKTTKVLYRPRQPNVCASSTDPMTWTSFEEAHRAYENDPSLDGVGFVFTEDAGIAGVDLDKCINDRGELEPWASEIVTALDSYTEVSPSGRGLHLIVEGKLPEGRRKKGSIEAYISGRYFTVTGDRLPYTPPRVEFRPAELAAFHAQYLADDRPQLRIVESESKDSGDDDALILEQARELPKFRLLYDHGDFRDYPSQSEADLALCGQLVKAGANVAVVDRLFRQSRLMRPKWDERRGTQTYGEQTIARALEQRADTNGKGTTIPKGLRVLSVRELAELPPAVAVVAGLLFADSLAVLVGAYASFKSFLALLLAVSVALGRECLGRGTKQGAVIYVFAEGAHGIRARMAALMTFIGVADVPGLYFIPQAVLLNTPAGLRALKEAIDRLQLPEPPALIVLDTVARTLHGSDSDTADMSGYVEAADDLRRHTKGPAILALHHFGWEEKRSRGSTVLPCSADTELHLFRDGDRVTVRNPKQKDGPEAADFTLEAVPFAGSLVLKPVGQDDSRLSENERACLKVVQTATPENGLTAGAIAQTAGLHRSSTYNALNRLERLAYVRKRKAAYSATEAGQAKLRELSNGQT